MRPSRQLTATVAATMTVGVLVWANLRTQIIVSESPSRFGIPWAVCVYWARGWPLRYFRCSFTDGREEVHGLVSTAAGQVELEGYATQDGPDYSRLWGNVALGISLTVTAGLCCRVSPWFAVTPVLLSLVILSGPTSMRVALLSAAVALFLGALVLGLVWRDRMKKHLASLSNIHSETDLALLKWAIARDMYASLVMFSLVVASLAVCNVGLIRGTLDELDTLCILICGGLCFVVGQRMKRLDETLIDLPADAEFKTEKDRVVHVWTHRALPDWK